jgi:hypothetical protein
MAIASYGGVDEIREQAFEKDDSLSRIEDLDIDYLDSLIRNRAGKKEEITLLVYDDPRDMLPSTEQKPYNKDALLKLIEGFSYFKITSGQIDRPRSITAHEFLHFSCYHIDMEHDKQELSLMLTDPDLDNVRYFAHSLVGLLNEHA